jgi:hypothetical protein
VPGAAGRARPRGTEQADRRPETHRGRQGVPAPAEGTTARALRYLAALRAGVACTCRVPAAFFLLARSSSQMVIGAAMNQVE